MLRLIGRRRTGECGEAGVGNLVMEDLAEQLFHNETADD